MPYEVEYEKEYDGKVLTVRPVKGHRTLPVLTLEVTPEELHTVSAHHRVRTLDMSHPGVTAYLFGKPGEVKIVHHDGEIVTVDSHEAALTHERPGEYEILKSAHDHFKRRAEMSAENASADMAPAPEPVVPEAEEEAESPPGE
jgi:hypothetical protein